MLTRILAGIGAFSLACWAFFLVYFIAYEVSERRRLSRPEPRLPKGARLVPTRAERMEAAKWLEQHPAWREVFEDGE